MSQHNNLDTTLDEISHRCRVLMESVPASSALTSQQISLRSQRSKNAHLTMMLHSLQSPPNDDDNHKNEASFPPEVAVLAAGPHYRSGHADGAIFQPSSGPGPMRRSAAIGGQPQGKSGGPSNNYFPVSTQYTRNTHTGHLLASYDSPYSIPRQDRHPISDTTSHLHSRRPRVIAAPDLDEDVPRHVDHLRSPARFEVQEDALKPPVYVPAHLHRNPSVDMYLARAQSELHSTSNYATGSDRRSRERQGSESRPPPPQLQDYVVAPRTTPSLTDGINRISGYRNDLSYVPDVAVRNNNVQPLHQDTINDSQYEQAQQQQQYVVSNSGLLETIAMPDSPPAHPANTSNTSSQRSTERTNSHSVAKSLELAIPLLGSTSHVTATSPMSSQMAVQVVQGTTRETPPLRVYSTTTDISPEFSGSVLRATESQSPRVAVRTSSAQTEEASPRRVSVSQPRSELRETGTMTAASTNTSTLGMVSAPSPKKQLASISVGTDSLEPTFPIGPPIIRRPGSTNTSLATAATHPSSSGMVASYGANYKHGGSVNRVIPPTEFRALLLSDWGPSLVAPTIQPSRSAPQHPSQKVKIFTDKDFPVPPTPPQSTKVGTPSKCC